MIEKFPQLKELQQRLLFGRQMFDVEITTFCNKCCYVCPREKLTRVGHEMTQEVFDSLCRWLPDDCDVFFAGLGEPLLHKQCTKYVHQLHLSGRKTSIMTNGQLLSATKVRELFAAGLDKLQISIIQKTDLASIKHFAALIADEYKGKVVFNIIKESESEEPQKELELLQEKGFGFCIKKVHNRAGHLYAEENIGDLQTCATFFCDTFISAMGEIFVCSNDINGRHSIGDIRNISFHDLLEYKKKFMGNQQICSICSQCTDEYRMKHFIS